MKFWLLKRKAERPAYDVANGFVVASASESEARHMAALECGDEGAATWISATLSTCVEMTPETFGEGVVLRDFNAG